MGILLNLYTKCLNSYKSRKFEEMRNFYNIKNGLNVSMYKINETLDDIENWEELLNLEEESVENKNKSIKKECKNCISITGLFGIIFCLLHLFGIQEGIIILNALFEEIVDEMLLLVKDTPRQYNFYENIEICSYKKIPEIDVAMITSSIGIIVLKKCGFLSTNYFFQSYSIIYFFLFFLFFDFHTNDQLSKNYKPIEIVVLMLSYVFLSILVGCSSMLALKEFYELYLEVYYRDNNEKNSYINEKAVFYLFPGLSLFFIILINRKIFTSFKDITSKRVLMTIIIIYFSSFILSNVFYCLYKIPIKNRERKEKNAPLEQKDKNENYNNNDKTHANLKLNVKEFEFNEILEPKNERKDVNIQKGNSKDRKIDLEETEYIRFNNSFPRIKNHFNSYKIKKIEIGKKTKIKINSAKAFTLCGYIYFQKTIGQKNVCIFYDYTGCCLWFKERVIKFDVILSISIEFLCQICNVGYKPLLSERISTVYSYKKNLIFLSALIFISLFFSIVYVGGCLDSIKYKNKNESGYFKYIDYITTLQFLLICFCIFTCITSICYLDEDDSTRIRWDNIIMAEFIFFKCLDFALLSFYDFYDNSDIINTSLAITFEKLLWMIIEAIIDSFEIKTKDLVMVQIIASSLFFLIIIISCFFLCYDKEYKKNKSKEIQKN